MFCSSTGPVEPPDTPKEVAPTLDHPQVPQDATPAPPQPPVSPMTEDLDCSQACAMLDAPDETIDREFQVRLEEYSKFDSNPDPNDVLHGNINPVVFILVPFHVEPTDDSVPESTSPEPEDRVPLLTVSDTSYCTDRRFAPADPATAHMSTKERQDHY